MLIIIHGDWKRTYTLFINCKIGTAATETITELGHLTFNSLTIFYFFSAKVKRRVFIRIYICEINLHTWITREADFRGKGTPHYRRKKN